MTSLEVEPAAENVDAYLSQLRGKRLGLVVNHTSMIGEDHLVDVLGERDMDIKILWAPEHGFRGTAYNGEDVADESFNDEILIRSLHGKYKKPQAEDLALVDLIIFDIQDVGARFYTYISTLHYVMEAAAESGVPVLVLDRPNPNGHYVDGPVLDPEFSSFIGKHPVPTVYGMTIGEYGQMINGEGWLKDGIKCELTVIPNSNYTHHSTYELPIPPSPNLPNQLSILLYPSLCFLEGTSVSLGRGTDMQFQVYGHPDLPKDDFSYTPLSMTSSKYPKHENQECGAIDLRSLKTDDIHQQKRLELSYLLHAYDLLKDNGKPFFLENNFINKLAGTDQFQKQILAGMSEDEIRATWQEDLEAFRRVRAKYLIYED